MLKQFVFWIFLTVLSLSACDTETDQNNSRQTGNNIADTIKTTRTEDSINMGRLLFKQNCAMCHAMGGIIEGPGLRDITSRVPQPYAKWLPSYIKNNVAVRKSGDIYAIKLYKDSDSASMPVFDTILNDNQIHYIMLFLENPPMHQDRY
jgi:mono/diheme cytochrome c family protein